MAHAGVEISSSRSEAMVEMNRWAGPMIRCLATRRRCLGTCPARRTPLGSLGTGGSGWRHVSLHYFLFQRRSLKTENADQAYLDAK